MADLPVYWYSRAKGIARMGTFATQLEAWESVMGHDGTPVEGALVWCEAKEQRVFPRRERAGGGT